MATLAAPIRDPYPSSLGYILAAMLHGDAYHLHAQQLGRALPKSDALAHEHQFLRGNVRLHKTNEDVHLVAESLECMRILGDTDADPLVQECSEWLMSMQNTDGSWDPEEETPFNKFHATMCAIQGLMVHKRWARAWYHWSLATA